MAEGITFEQQGYETFDEFPGKRGVSQNLLSTIEFGLSPFVPLSQQYKMYYGDLPSNGFGVHASDGGKLKADDKLGWKKKIDDYGVEKLVGDVRDKSPDTQIEQRAKNLSHQITLLLEQEGIASEFDSKVRGEVEDQAVARMLRSEFPDDWKDSRYNEQIKLVSGSTGKLGKETFDLYGRTQASADVLEYNLHFLSRQLGEKGPAFVQGVKAMETTNMSKSKRMQGFMQKNTQYGIDNELAWKEGVHAAVDEMKELWDFGTKGFKKIHEDIGKQPEHKGGETAKYFARQMLSRFAEIEAGQFGDAFIYQAPIGKGGKFESGYARIEPVIKDGFLKDVKIKTAIVGGAAFQKLVEGAGDGIFQKAGSQYQYASHAQLLLWDAATRHELSHKQLLALSTPISQQAANELALRGGRGNMMGSSLRIEMETGLGNLIQGSARVQAVEVIGSTEATALVEKQVKAFFEDPGIAKQFEKFYLDAMDASQEVTSTWKSNVGADNRTVNSNAPGGIYAASGGPFTDQQNLEGVGIPFWFMIGRDPTGFEKFKTKETHSKEKFAAENVMKKGKVIPEDRRGVLMKGTGPLAGQHMAVKNPQDYYIARTDKPAYRKAAYGETITKSNQAELSWRQEEGLGGFGEHSVEDILTNGSRVGGY